LEKYWHEKCLFSLKIKVTIILITIILTYLISMFLLRSSSHYIFLRIVYIAIKRYQKIIIFSSICKYENILYLPIRFHIYLRKPTDCIETYACGFEMQLQYFDGKNIFFFYLFITKLCENVLWDMGRKELFYNFTKRKVLSKAFQLSK